MKTSALAAIIVVFSFSVDAAVNLPEKENFKIVILAGQSNMAGRGKIDPMDNKPHPRVVMMDRAGNWVPCVDPVHFDIVRSGVGPGKTFGEALANSDPAITVGLVPTAVGGTSVTQWEPGATAMKGKITWHPYDDSIARSKKALEQGTLAAILWHQGEADCSKNRAYLYQVRFPQFISRFRTELGAEGVPLIIGGLRTDLAGGYFGKIVSNCQQLTCEHLYGPGKFVPAKNDYGLEKDKIHFDAKSQRDFGCRYFEAYLAVMSELKSDPLYWKKKPVPQALEAKPIPEEQKKYIKLNKNF